jgi:secondary thiamine-phosphate synthase enzyme
MQIHQDTIEVLTAGRGPVDVTDRIAAVVRKSGVDIGLCTVFVQHTSASLLIQENADPTVLTDLARWLSELAPESRLWKHDDEGPDDMPAHARAAIMPTSETIPISKSRLALGTWQGIYLWEHRSVPHRRRIVVHVAGR